MEILGLVNVPIWLLLLIGCLALLYEYGIYPFSTWSRRGIEGPKPVPFFGNALKLFSPRHGSRRAIQDWIDTYGPVFGMYSFRDPCLVVADPEFLKQVLVKHFNNFSDRYLLGGASLNNRVVRKGLFFECGADWKRIRRIMNPIFSSGKLKQLVEITNRYADHLADVFRRNASEKALLPAKDVFAAYTLDLIAGIAFGLDINSQTDRNLPFIKNAKDLLTFGLYTRLQIFAACLFPPSLLLIEFLNLGIFNYSSCDYFERSVNALIKSRRNMSEEEKPRDFLQLLLNAEAEEEDSTVEKKLTSEEIAAQCIIMIIAGYETTSTLLQYTCFELAKNKQVQDKLWEEIRDEIGNNNQPTYEQVQGLKYLSAVVNETLRMYPPLTQINRRANKACVINGISIPEGAGILIPTYSIGRNPDFYEDPNTFKPERFLEKEILLNDITFLPFGFGPRHCIGIRLALFQAKLALLRVMQCVSIEDVLPDKLEFNDTTALLVPITPIELSVKAR